jgi:chemotaxis protein methyltransferase CheR
VEAVLNDRDCVAFLQWALPRLHLRWSGFRKPRRQVCRRIARRVRELELAGVQEYSAYLEAHPTEWSRLDTLCRIPISRFHRDRAVFEQLVNVALPGLGREVLEAGGSELRCWSAGCASGEEPYTLALIWKLVGTDRLAGVSLRIIATDADPNLLRRARRACYRRSSLKELPDDWVARAFRRSGSLWCLVPEMRGGVEFRLQDIRSRAPRGPFDLILCRNLAFTYFDEELQHRVLSRIRSRLRPCGILVIGPHESLPDADGFVPLGEQRGLYERVG